MMCELLEHKNTEIYSLALRYLGCILSSDDPFILEEVMKGKIIDKITQILFSQNENVVKEGLWTLSNLTASGPE
jgi:hypothetical protein